MKSSAVTRLDLNSSRSENYREKVEICGGQALGLKILEELIAINGSSFRIPPYVTLPIKDLQEGNTIRPISELADLGDKVVCRWSGIREAFSLESCRGANSSLGNPLLSVDDLLIGHIRRWLALSQNETHRAIILQSWVSQPSAIGFHCHCHSDRAFVELTYGETKYLLYYLFKSRKEFCSGIFPEEMRSAIDEVKYLSRRLFSLLNFPLDLEGFIEKSDVTILQFRPIPEDFSFSSRLSEEILVRLNKGDFQVLGWPQNSYCITADYARRPLYLNERHVVSPSPQSIRDEVEPLRSLIQLGLVPEDRGNRLIAALGSMQCWHSPEFCAGLSRNQVMLHISPKLPSVLEHDPTRLPPAGGLRKAYNCFYSSEISDKDAHRYSFLSDGYVAIAT